jgi:hypothetical protein
VLISTSPSRASSVPAFATTDSPPTGTAKANASVRIVTVAVTSITFCAGMGTGSRRASRNAGVHIPKCRRKRSVTCLATSGAPASQCWPHSISSGVADPPIVEERIVARPPAA